MKKIYSILVGLFIVFGSIAQESKPDLKTRIDVIRNETVAGANTKTRIANAYQEIADGMISIYPVSASGTDTYTGSLQGLDAYSGRIVFVSFANNNTGAATLNIGGIGAANIQKYESGWTALEADDIVAGKLYRLYHDGTRFQIDLGGSGGGAGLVADAINNGTTAIAPSQNAVFDALALKQDLDSDLTAIAGLSPSNDDIIQRKAGAWTNRTIAQVKTDLNLVSDPGATLGGIPYVSSVGSPNVYSELADIATGNAIISGGVGSAPSYGKITDSHVSGQFALSHGGTAANLSDPGADRLWGWDDTDNSIGFWTIGTGLSYDHSTHTLSTSAGGFVTLGGAETITNKTISTGTIISASPTISDGVKITFNPDGTNPGLNIGSHTANPSSLSTLDVWGNSTSSRLLYRDFDASTIEFLGQLSGGGVQSRVPFYSSTTNRLTNDGDLTFTSGTTLNTLHLTLGTAGILTYGVGSNTAYDKTITAGGTTGNQTINKLVGTVNFAAAATTLTVTNSLVTTSSIVFCVVRTNDNTAVIKNVVPSSGSFVITLNAAATAETSVGFHVIN